jgi:anti-sigma factor RsiW
VATMTPYCWLIRRRLGAYQDGELSPGARDRVSAHVRGCESCARESAALGRLRTALTLDTADPPEAVWTAFWPQVRARIATTAPVPEPVGWRAWEGVRPRPRLGLVPALAAGALAVLAMVAPWQRAPQQTPTPSPTSVAGGLEIASIQPAALDQVVIQSISTEDPDVPVMVYASPESDVTVLWVFGLPQTDA